MQQWIGNGMRVNRSTWGTVALAIVAASAAPALSASGTWNGSTSTDWDDPLNWVSGNVPNDATPADTVHETATFNANVPNDNPTLDVNIAIGTLAITNTAAATTVSSTSNKLTFTGAFNATSISNAQANIIDLDVDLNYTGGTLTVGSTSSLTFAAGNTLNLRPTNTARMAVNGGGVVTVNSSVDETGAGNAGLNVTNGTLNFNPAAMLNASAITMGVQNTLNGAGNLNLHTSLTAAQVSSITLGDNNANQNSINTLRLSVNGLAVGSALSITGAGSGTGTKSHTFDLDLAGTNSASFTGNLLANASVNVATETFSVGLNDTLTFSGILNFSATANYAIQKTGDGTLILSGTGANNFASASTFAVTDGTLQLEKTGVNAINNNLSVSSGASVKLAAANQITNTSAITLLGGKFDTNGLNETLGALTVDGTGSAVDFGAGSSIVQFASGTHIAGGLTIFNWDGPADSWRFSSDPTAFVTALGNNLVFDGYGAGGTVTDLGGGTWEVTPVPEPASAFFLLVGATSVLSMRRRNR